MMRRRIWQKRVPYLTVKCPDQSGNDPVQTLSSVWK